MFLFVFICYCLLLFVIVDIVFIVVFRLQIKFQSIMSIVNEQVALASAEVTPLFPEIKAICSQMEKQLPQAKAPSTKVQTGIQILCEPHF